MATRQVSLDFFGSRSYGPWTLIPLVETVVEGLMPSQDWVGLTGRVRVAAVVILQGSTGQVLCHTDDLSMVENRLETEL